ncbi:MAG: DKNYY domain-containing protein [Nanoarchaeota archaeon]|nr:DKNYY domain-containing protein [Nanoarchaeota archaeon]
MDKKNNFSSILLFIFLGVFIVSLVAIFAIVSILSNINSSSNSSSFNLANLFSSNSQENFSIQLKDKIFTNLDSSISQVDLETFEILTTRIAKDENQLYFIQSYKDSRNREQFSLQPIPLPSSINILELTPVYHDNYYNDHITTNFFTDSNSIYYFHEQIRDSYSNTLFEPLENITIASWRRVNNSEEFSNDEHHIYFGSSIIANISSNVSQFQYFGNSYLFYNEVLYFRNIPLIKLETINDFQTIHDDFNYKLLNIDNSIWIHQTTPARNIFLQNISSPSTFTYLGRQRENQRLFNSFGLTMFHDLFEDSQNYYSLTSAVLPRTSSTFGVRRVNYLEEMEVVQYFEVHPKN